MSMTTENRDVDDQSTQSAITDSKHFWFWDQLIVLLYPQGAELKVATKASNLFLILQIKGWNQGFSYSSNIYRINIYDLHTSSQQLTNKKKICLN